MKVYILGSTKFVDDMVRVIDELKALGVDAWIHPDYIEYVKHPEHAHLKQIEAGEQWKVKKANDYIRQHYNGILESDAVLFVNLKKGEIENYIGGNALMEMGMAYVNGKKIYLLNNIPEIQYKDEIVAMQPICLEGDLNNLQ